MRTGALPYKCFKPPFLVGCLKAVSYSNLLIAINKQFSLNTRIQVRGKIPFELSRPKIPAPLHTDKSIAD